MCEINVIRLGHRDPDTMTRIKDGKTAFVPELLLSMSTRVDISFIILLRFFSSLFPLYFCPSFLSTSPALLSLPFSCPSYWNCRLTFSLLFNSLSTYNLIFYPRNDLLEEKKKRKYLYMMFEGVYLYVHDISSVSCTVDKCII